MAELGILVPRIIPRVRALNYQEARRITIVGYEYPLANPVLKDCVLTPKYICSYPMAPSQPALDGAVAELYGFVDSYGDIEALLHVVKTVEDPQRINWWLIREGGRKMDVHFDDNLVVTWPEADWGDVSLSRWNHTETQTNYVP